MTHPAIPEVCRPARALLVFVTRLARHVSRDRPCTALPCRSTPLRDRADRASTCHVLLPGFKRVASMGSCRLWT